MPENIGTFTQNHTSIYRNFFPLKSNTLHTVLLFSIKISVNEISTSFRLVAVLFIFLDMWYIFPFFVHCKGELGWWEMKHLFYLPKKSVNTMIEWDKKSKKVFILYFFPVFFFFYRLFFFQLRRKFLLFV